MLNSYHFQQKMHAVHESLLFAYIALLVSVFPPILAQAASTDSGADKHSTYTVQSRVQSGQLSNPRSDVEAFWAFLQRMDRSLRDMHASGNISRVDIGRLFSLDCSSVGMLTDRGRAFREEARASADDPGLDFEGGIRKGFSETNSGVDANSRQSAFLGFRWDMLNSGWRENKGRGRWYDLRADRANVRAKMEYEDRLNQCRADKIPNAFLPQKYRLLGLKIDLLRLLLSASRDAYLRGSTYLEDMLENEQELQVASNDLSGIRPKLAMFSRRELMFPDMLPLLDVDITGMIGAIAADKRLEQLAALETNIISQKKENDKETLLYVFLRYEANNTAFRRRGPSAGLRFKVPIFENTGVGLSAYRAANDARRRTSEAMRKRDAEHAYGKFLEERERVVWQWYRYVRALERLRRSRVQERFDHWTVDAEAAAERAATVIDAAIELERANALMYRRVSEIFSAAHLLYQPRFITIAPMIGEGYRGRSGLRALYIWSKAFNARPNDFLRSFLRAKEIKTVLLSTGKAVNRKKFSAFLIQARRDRLRVEPMFSDNGWLDKGHYADAVKKIRVWTDLENQVSLDVPVEHLQQPRLTLQNIGGPEVLMDQETDKRARRKRVNIGYNAIHLDIEPQALQRYKGKSEAQAAALTGLLQYLQRHLPENMKISVSLPVSWNADAYRSIARLADRLYMMSYGTSKYSTIVRRLNTVRKTVSDAKIVVALRASDYRSERDLEHTIDEITGQTAIRHFAIHAMRGYLELTDKRAAEIQSPDRIVLAGRK